MVVVLSHLTQRNFRVHFQVPGDETFPMIYNMLSFKGTDTTAFTIYRHNAPLV